MSMRRVLLIPLFLISSFLTGCASVKPVPVENFSSPDGIPYYEGSHYLLIYPDGKGATKWKLEFIPDLHKKREYRTNSFLASAITNVTFTNGILDSGESKLDSTAVSSAVLEQVVSLAKLAAFNDPGGKSLEPKLYKVLVKRDGTIELREAKL